MQWSDTEPDLLQIPEPAGNDIRVSTLVCSKSPQTDLNCLCRTCSASRLGQPQTWVGLEVFHLGFGFWECRTVRIIRTNTSQKPPLQLCLPTSTCNASFAFGFAMLRLWSTRLNASCNQETANDGSKPGALQARESLLSLDCGPKTDVHRSSKPLTNSQPSLQKRRMHYFQDAGFDIALPFSEHDQGPVDMLKQSKDLQNVQQGQAAGHQSYF